MTPQYNADELEIIERIHECEKKGSYRLSLGWKKIRSLPQEIEILSEKLTDIRIVSCNHLFDLSAAENLPKLRHIDLRSANALTDLSSLSGLQELERLFLDGCNSLTGLGALHHLPKLRVLTLSNCNNLSSLSGIEQLPSLIRLELRNCPNLVDLSSISSLVNIKHLDLSFCAGLRVLRGDPHTTKLNTVNLRALKSLDHLRVLKILASFPLDIGPDIHTNDCWPLLQELYCDHIEGAPAELGSGERDDNCLRRLVAWRNDLSMGFSSNSQLKLLILGNGRVGKTQITRRLASKDFDPRIASTHGVQLVRVTLIDADARALPSHLGVELNVWDFGGQDIYLGTHALFLDSRAIYLLAWNPRFEFGEQVFEHGEAFKNRSLNYWLEYINSLAGLQAPVLTVQTQCDQESDVDTPPRLPDHLHFGWLRNTYCSAATVDGMERLLLELKTAAKVQLERYNDVLLPVNWIAVSNELRRKCEVLRHKTISLKNFRALCQQEHFVTDPDALLAYLHRSGQVFWREGIFDNQVVLAQQWALEGVYAILDREKVLPIIRQQHGRFTAELLHATVWRDRTPNERKLFLSMMEKCKICFRIGRRGHDFIAPGQLPPEAKMDEFIRPYWRDTNPTVKVKLKYSFLHDGVMNAVLCEIGMRAGSAAVYWGHGACFYDSETEAVVRIRSGLPEREGGGWIKVESAGERSQSLVRIILDLILGCNIGAEPDIEWDSANKLYGQRHTNADSLRGSSSRLASRGENAKHFADLRIVQPPRYPEELPAVYVSYAWGCPGSTLADQLEVGLTKLNISLVRDKNKVRTGEWISRFIAELGRADQAVLLINDKYLRSPYCMRELLYLFQTSSSDFMRLDNRVVPVLDEELKISRAYERANYVAYWAEEAKKLSEIYEDLPLLSLSDADRQEWLATLDFCHRVSDLMAWVADKLMPRNASGVDAAIEIIAQRIGQATSQK